MTTIQNKQDVTELLDLSSQELEQMIEHSIKKIGCRKENDLCHYFPMPSGGYMHHFTFKKWKTQMPKKLGAMLKNFILNTSQPIIVDPKKRAPRGSRKKKDHFVIPKQEIDRILSLARAAGDKELICKLLPKRDFRTLKRDLISSIKHNRLEPELWHSYTEWLAQPKQS